MLRLTFAAAGVLLAAYPPALAQPAAGLSMTCNPVYQGNDLGPQVYRVEGVRLVKTDPAVSGPIVLSSAVRREPLDRTVDKGVVTYTSASHRLQGPVLTRRVFWTDAAGRVTRTLTETYDFRAKTIRDLTGQVQRCR